MLEPASVALKFGFLAVLYLFLLWVSRSALKDLRRRAGSGTPPGRHAAPRPDATGLHAPAPPSSATSRGWSSSARPGTRRGWSTTSASGAVLGRGEQVEIRLEDPFASSRHARVVRQGGVMVLEDLGSTNGTYLNEELLGGPAAAAPRRPRADRRQRVHLR